MFRKKDIPEEPEEERFNVEPVKKDQTVLCYIITDKETGVQYLYAWGGSGSGLTPLLDEDGRVSIKK
ncbi:DUF6440 family protein [Salinicoccus sp. HZC-1]|uniref:DUF6440 family protein n=1 Tax=Salinicoccus sp. HZC-1 TaxID=3385497 RepID=UPI00398AC8F1